MNIIEAMRYLTSLPYHGEEPKMVTKDNCNNTFWVQTSTFVKEAIIDEKGIFYSRPATFDNYDILHDNYRIAKDKDIIKLRDDWLIYIAKLKKLEKKHLKEIEINQNYDSYDSFSDCMFDKGYNSVDMNKIRWQLRYYLWRIFG